MDNDQNANIKSKPKAVSNYKVLSLSHSKGSESYVGNRIPPHSNDAEISVIGAMMLERSAISKVIEIIDNESFYNMNHRLIFESIVNIFDKGISVDLVTVADDLNRKNQLEAIGGTYYLADINSRVPTAANVEYHARIMQEKYLKRCLISAAGTILENSYDESTDALDEIDYAETEIFKIAEKRFGKSYQDINSLTHETLDIIHKLAEREKDSFTGIPSGFSELDKLTGGFQNSDLIVIAARPSMGKTALALSMARNVAVDYKKPIAFFSIEMSAIQLVIRLMAAETHINAQKIRTGNVSYDDVKTIVNKIGSLAESPLFIDDSPTLSLTELRAKARRLKIEHGVKIIMVDYLQLLHPPKAESREREISIISRSLKQLAKELDIPIVALSQLNRGVEGRKDKQPMLSDLRESGSIEQDADVVMFIYRPEVYGIKTWPDNQQPTENTADIIVGKQRNGPTGITRLVYQKDFAKFENGIFGSYSEYNPMSEEVDEYNEDTPF